MRELLNYFITSQRDYIEGDVYTFKQTIHITSLKKATLFSTALGIYEIECNHKKIGNQLFAPGYTYYPKHLNYQTYDITSDLLVGDNELKVYLAQGWYSGRFTHENKTQIYGSKNAIAWIVQIEDYFGHINLYTSLDNAYEVSNEYLYAGFYDGEVVDRRLTEKYIGKPNRFEGTFTGTFSESIEKVIINETITPKKIIKHQKGAIVDFGQNFAGFITIDPTCMQCSTITIKHGEIIDKHGDLYTGNLRKAKALIKFTKNDSKTLYIPRFTYMGFRYIQIVGCEYIDGMIEAHAIYDDMKRTGYFRSENQFVNQLYENQIWGQKSNYIEVPTDCPQRDERMGYPGDGHVFAKTGAFNFDTRNFWKKFLLDITYSQLDNSEGYVPPNIPASGKTSIGFLSMLGWGNAVTIIPELLYHQYNDLSFLDNQYESMKKHVDAEIRKCGANYLWLSPNLGDWLAPGRDLGWFASNHGPVSNAFVINDLRILIWYASLRNHQQDLMKYKELYLKVKEAYINLFLDDQGKIQGDYQGAYIMALKYVLDDYPNRNLVMHHFVENVRKNGLQTGFFGTQYLLPLLIESGNTKLAYDVLLNEQYPGWMYQIKKGATTIWERWNSLLEDGSVNEVKITSDNMVSFNHYAFGSVGEFYYQYILGIKALLPGYRKVLIEPFPDDRLKSVKGEYHSINGIISVEWTYKDGVFELTTTVPVDSCIKLPNGFSENVPAGTYSYRIHI